MSTLEIKNNDPEGGYELVEEIRIVENEVEKQEIGMQVDEKNKLEGQDKLGLETVSDLNLDLELNLENKFFKGQDGHPAGILQADRRQHLYVLGKTGMGKTTLLQNMLLQDIENGCGVCYIDPHGDSCEYVLDRIPEHRHKDVIYINPADINHPVSINILEAQRGEPPYLIASSLMAVFNKIWIGTWSSRMEYILNNTLLSLLERKGNTLLGVLRMLTDEDYRLKTIKRLKDPVVKAFWLNEFENFHDRYRQEAISPILNKIGQFFSSEVIRNILGQSKSTIDFRAAMDEGKIVLVNLSKGKLGEDNSNLLGSLLVAKLQTSALSRVDIPEQDRRDFYLYVDEFQNFTTDSFAGILSEARKFRLNLVLAHQYISQLEETGTTKVKNAVFGNVGSIVCFRLGASDARAMSEEMAPELEPTDFLRLNRGCIAVRLSKGGRIMPAQITATLPDMFENQGGNYDTLVELSRQKYSRDGGQVATQTKEWMQKVYQEEWGGEEMEQLEIFEQFDNQLNYKANIEQNIQSSKQFYSRSNKQGDKQENNPKKHQTGNKDKKQAITNSAINSTSNGNERESNQLESNQDDNNNQDLKNLEVNGDTSKNIYKNSYKNIEIRNLNTAGVGGNQKLALVGLANFVNNSTNNTALNSTNKFENNIKPVYENSSQKFDPVNKYSDTQIDKNDPQTSPKISYRIRVLVLNNEQRRSAINNRMATKLLLADYQIGPTEEVIPNLSKQIQKGDKITLHPISTTQNPIQNHNQIQNPSQQKTKLQPSKKTKYSKNKTKN